MDPNSLSTNPSAINARQSLMRLCAQATEAELQRALTLLEPLPSIHDVRTPDTGLVMLRGRTGGEGQAFNLGEATVTRAAVTLDSGESGFSYILGRSPAKARLAAIVDALGQNRQWRDRLNASFVVPVSARLDADRASQRARTEATKVNFFTLVRGED
jgi:alpha-D-ribose 1-methylphosphonate 5-triphosphate synthase subunit PhnG